MYEYVLACIVTLHGFKIAISITLWCPHSLVHDERNHAQFINLLTLGKVTSSWSMSRAVCRSKYFTALNNLAIVRSHTKAMSLDKNENGSKKSTYTRNKIKIKCETKKNDEEFLPVLSHCSDSKLPKASHLGSHQPCHTTILRRRCWCSC